MEGSLGRKEHIVLHFGPNSGQTSIQVIITLKGPRHALCYLPKKLKYFRIKWIPKIMVHFCYLRQYLGIETVCLVWFERYRPPTEVTRKICLSSFKLTTSYVMQGTWIDTGDGLQAVYVWTGYGSLNLRNSAGNPWRLATSRGVKYLSFNAVSNLDFCSPSLRSLYLLKISVS